MSFNAHDIVFFFGAGASAPFGIPTMKQFVVDFENELNENGSDKEKAMYARIKKILEERLDDSVDLEGIFTVIDGIINYCPERLGLLSLYLAKEFKPPNRFDVEICQSLKEKFHSFVREKCLIPKPSFNKISEVYRDFFNRFWRESNTHLSDTYRSSGPYRYCTDWTMFTTNYDTCLEHYWRQVARVNLNTASKAREETRTWILAPELFADYGLRLFKLHGSISWLLEPDGTITEEQTLMGRQLVGRQFVGEMMVYPIQQKELYLEPYISMLKQLNYQLKLKPIWIVVGYSFNDPIIQEIFVRNSDKNKKIVLLHPQAQQVKEKRLKNVKCEKISLLNQKFGESNFRDVNYALVNEFKPKLQYSPESVV
jgi:hypothetical protein